MYIAKPKDGQKRAKKTFSMILETVFEMVWWTGANGNHVKKDLWSWSIFLLSKCWLPLLFVETLRAFFLFSFSFFFSFFFFFYDLSLEDLGVLMIFEEKITSSKTSFQMAWQGMAWSWLWIYWRWTHIPEWSYACQYRQTMIMEMWELWIYRWWTHIPEWRYACQYFWVRLANNVGSKYFLKKNQNSIGDIP
jgi:hypothetical protein